MNLTNYLENRLIDCLLRGQTFAFPATVYVGLFTSATDDAGGGTEVTGGSYVRAAVAASLANWAGTQSAGSTAVSTGTSGQTSNNAAITFPAPTANWNVITHFALFDAPTAGNMLIWAQLPTPKTVNSGDAAPVFNAGALTVAFA